jgi:acyl carrier protein
LNGQDAAATVAIAGVPSVRTKGDVTAWRLLENDTAHNVADLRVAAQDAAGGLHPEDVWALGQELPYAVEIRWSEGAAAGTFDVLFIGRNAPSGFVRGVAARASSGSPEQGYANDPAAKQAPAPKAGALRDHLRQRLPDYMVPSAFVMLDALPLTGNGKLDVTALPRPGEAPRHDEGKAGGAPQTELERAVAGVWADVLRLEQVGRTDDFFERGGHSLLAVQVIVKLRDMLHVDISLGSLFEAPTVEQLARRIEALQYVRSAVPAARERDLEEIEL